MSKTCGHCEQIKELAEFARNRCKSDGYSAVCKECTGVYTKSWYTRNKQKHKRNTTNSRKLRIVQGSTAEIEYSRWYRKKHKTTVSYQLSSRLSDARKRSRKKKLVCNITLEYLLSLWEQQRGLCALSDVEMTLISEKARAPLVVSIDRIDNTRGYEVGNIRLVTWAVNRALADMGTAAFIAMCEAVINKERSK